MILFIGFLLLVEGARLEVSCRASGAPGSEDFGAPSIREDYRQDDNSILDSIRGRDTKPSSPRSKRAVESSTGNAAASTNVDYEKAINQTIFDYHAQRKAVMDRYYARQREIVEKFARRKSQTSGTTSTTTLKPAVSQTTSQSTTNQTLIDRTTERNYFVDGRKKYDDNGPLKPVPEERNDREEKNNSTNSWSYRSTNWNPRVVDGEHDIDLQPESSNTLERSVARSEEIPGYYKLGNFRGTKDEKIVYQHNLGVGLKGSSQLDATFEAVIEGPYEITIVEAFPYANTRANFTWLSGGPGTNSVKLKLQGYENEGFSYSVKVWGVPIKGSK